MQSTRSLLVVRAHPGDFVWRAGGAIALAAAAGDRVVAACLSHGERGESATLWREGATPDQIKVARRGEAEAVAAILRAEVEFLDAGGTPPVTVEEEVTGR